MIHRALLLFTIAALSACGGSPPPRPSVLLMTLDTTRADYLGCYGRPGDPTPELDALAAAGTRFDLAIASASVTPVAHATILTGQRNHEHGLRVLTAPGGYRLPRTVPTFAQILREEGFRTHAIHSAFPVSSYFGLDTGFDPESFDELSATFEVEDGAQHAEWDVKNFQRRSDETSDRVIAFLKSTPSPFFLWVHYWDPHDNGRKPPGSTAKGYKNLYEEEVRYMDGEIGRVFAHLKETGRWDDTIVVVVADHGQGLGDHGWSGHRTLHQEQIRVPLLLRVPGAEQKGVVPELVRTQDILPTVLDYLAVPTPTAVTGVSARALVEGTATDRRIAFADQINALDQNAKMVQDRPTDDFLYTAMDAEWKLIYRPTNPHLSELYNLDEDPEELDNRYDAEPGQVLRLMTELANEAPWVTEPFEPIEDEGRGSALDALNALGYAEGDDDGGPVELSWSWVCPDPAHEGVSERSGLCTSCATPLVPRRR